jgi:hypothetical protein
MSDLALAMATALWQQQQLGLVTALSLKVEF